MHSTMASPTSTSPTTTAHHTDQPNRHSAKYSVPTSAPTATRCSYQQKLATPICGPAHTETGDRANSLMASLDQSLRRMNLDYVDIFYIHRFDPRLRSRKHFRHLSISCAQAKPSTQAYPVGLSEATKLAFEYLDRRDTLPPISRPSEYARPFLGILRNFEETQQAGRRIHRIFATRSRIAHKPLSSRVPSDSRAAHRDLISEGRHNHPRNNTPHTRTQRYCRIT